MGFRLSVYLSNLSAILRNLKLAKGLINSKAMLKQYIPRLTIRTQITNLVNNRSSSVYQTIQNSKDSLLRTYHVKYLKIFLTKSTVFFQFKAFLIKKYSIFNIFILFLFTKFLIISEFHIFIKILKQKLKSLIFNLVG